MRPGAERAAGDLEAEGYLTRHKLGARNFYEIHPHGPLRPPAQPGTSVGDLLHVLLDHRSSQSR